MLNAHSDVLEVTKWRSTEELVMILTDIQASIATFNRLEISTPNWLIDKEQDFLQAIALLHKKELKAELERWQERANNLKPADERKAEIEAKMAGIRAKL
jgi:hypothetical protein